MHRCAARATADVEVDFCFRLVAAPCAGAVAQQEIDEIARFVARSVQADIGNFHRRFMDRMEHGQGLVPAFAGCKVRIVLVDRHLESLVTQYNSRSGTGNLHFHNHHRFRNSLAAYWSDAQQLTPFFLRALQAFTASFCPSKPPKRARYICAPSLVKATVNGLAVRNTLPPLSCAV